MNYYRVSKYDPIYRNHKGLYIKDEWTDFSDVGKVFDGKILEIEEYRKIEKNYISFICDVLSITNDDVITISKLENYDKTAWKNLTEISRNEIELLVEDCLRSKCWCEIVSDSFVVTFGYEFYMYIKTKLSSTVISQIGTSNHLFIEILSKWPWEDNR